MAGKVGEVYYDVLPNLDRFASMVAAGIGQQKPIKIGVDADTRAAAANLKNVTGATTGLTAAQNRLASAQGAARVSALRLNETKAKAAVGSARLAAAEESHGRALRNLGIAQAAAFAAIPQAQTNYQKFNKVLGDPAIQRAGTGMLKFGAAGAVAIGGVVAVSANFEKAVSRVAATGDDAKGSIGRLSQEALKYGAATAFSATEAANAQAELIKANVSVTDTINGGLKGALDLAAAGELDVATAAGIMGTAMSQFQIPGTQASHVADLLAAAAGKAQGEVGDFSEALKYVGPLAHGAGVSIEETTGTLAAFANVGILGSQAGTSFRGVLVGLTAPSAAGAAAMEKYGINVRDASGQFIGMQGAAGQLADKLGNLSDAERDAALSRIFGRNSLTAARALYEEGAAGINRWTKAVDDSGFAADNAAEKQNNLIGDIEKLTGAFETAFIKTGKSAQGPARQLTQSITGIVDAYSNLNEQTQGGILVGTAIAAAAVLVVGAGVKIVGAVSAINAALVTMSATAPRAGAALAGVGKYALGPLAIAATAVTTLGIAFDVLGSKAPAADQVTRSLDGLAKGSNDLTGLYSGSSWIDDLGSSLFLSQAPANNLKDALNRLGVEYDPLASGAAKASLSFLKFTESIIPGAQSLEKAKSQVDQVDAALAQMVSSGNAEGAKRAFDTIWKDSGQPLETLLPLFKQYEAAIGGVKTGNESAAAAATKSLGALNAVGDAIAAVGGKSALSAAGVDALTKSLFTQADAASQAVNAELAYEASIDAAREAAKRNGETLNENTAKGRENVAALQQQGAASRAYVSSLIAQGASQGKVVSATRAARDAVIANAKAMGASGPEARKLADDLGLIPKDVKTKYELQKAKEEQAKMEQLKAAIQKLPKEHRTKVQALIDQGKFKEAEKLVNTLKREVKPPIKPQLFPGDIRVAENALNALKKPVAPPIKPKLLPGDIRVAENSLNNLKRPVAPPIKPKVNAGDVRAAEASIRGIKGRTVPVPVRTTGVPKAKADIRGIKGHNVPIPVRERGVARTKRDINSIKGVSRSADIRERGVQKTKSQFNSIKGVSRNATVRAVGVGSTQSAINRIRGKGVDAHVIATGVSGAQSAINGIRGKTVTVTVVTKKVTQAAGGGLYTDGKLPKFASGGLGEPGLIRGPGGPTGDLINARLSDYEFVQRAAAVRKYGVDFMERLNSLSIDRDELPGFKAGALARAVPARYSAPSGASVSSRSAPTRVTLNVDLGRELGGLRQFVYDIVDDGREHELTLGRMN